MISREELGRRITARLDRGEDLNDVILAEFAAACYPATDKKRSAPAVENEKCEA